MNYVNGIKKLIETNHLVSQGLTGKLKIVSFLLAMSLFMKPSQSATILCQTNCNLSILPLLIRGSVEVA